MRNLLRTRIVFCPDPDKLVQMVSTQDGTVSGEVVEVVHDDGHEQVEHEEAAEEDEGDKEEVGDVAAAGLARLQQLPGGAVLLDGPGVTLLSGSTGQHDVRPGLSCSTSATKGWVLQLLGVVFMVVVV